MKQIIKSEINVSEADDCLVDVFGNMSLDSSPNTALFLNQKFEVCEELYNSPNSNVYLVSIPSGISLSEKISDCYKGNLGAVKVVNGSTFCYLLDKEYQILKSLDHPNIVKPLDYKSSDAKDSLSASYMCVPFYKNGELYELVKTREGLGEIDSMKIFCQIISAIEYLHEQNIVHRDIKLENILLDDFMAAQLIDFGFSYKLDTDLERDSGKIISECIENQLCGTLSYMAPELIESMGKNDIELSFTDNSDYYVNKIEKLKATDIYALGVALFTMVVGVPPFGSATKNDPNFRNFLLSMKHSTASRFWSRHPKAKILLEKGELSSEFMSLIEDMLNPNIEKRIRINSILNHSWIQRG